ncbi:Methyltransferase-like protein 7B [Psilocybe cubensis]|uniref:S-adenosyl-L-methionine-dependent methyltransferase n=2 Tax=Psilocybe cubensis TaxID=181762 RepID=A0A8H7XMD5_PSICU|nr:Methyltransferase-like protein 7B [Psilocybe cubensis]KAH9475072.1 Methyltransferase-like protein 7B [Psilocybe cubensis]
MKFQNAISLLGDLRLAISIALIPTLKAVVKEPTLLFRWQALSRVFFARMWVDFGDGIDGNCKDVKENLITPNAYGVVLDVGAGFGHTAKYLNRARVTRYVALEPNVLMHDKIRGHANAAGFHESDGTLVILSCGAEESSKILSALSSFTTTSTKSPTAPLIDTIVAILTLCTIPEPQKSVTRLAQDILKPGGQLLMYEHVLHTRADIQWWQRFWAPVWACAFDGCRIDRPTDIWVRDIKDRQDQRKSVWREVDSKRKEAEDEETLFGHIIGRFVKA